MSDIKRLLLGYMYMIWQLCCCIIATLHRLKMDSFSSFLFDILVLKVYSADTIGLVSGYRKLQIAMELPLRIHITSMIEYNRQRQIK